MSWQTQEAVLKHSQSKNGARLVLLVIAYHADEHGEHSFPSIGTIAREANLSERSVWRALEELRALGELGIEGGAGLVATASAPYKVSLLLTGEEEGAGTDILSVEDAPRTDILSVDTEPTHCQIVSEPLTYCQSPTDILSVHALTNWQQEPSIFKSQDEELINTPTDAHAHAHAREGARAREGTGEGAREGEGALRALLSDRAGEEAPPAYGGFDQFWKALLREYPARGKVDLDTARLIAREILRPSEWGGVVDAARHYSRSSVVLRGKVRNLPNFLGGESWRPYQEAPIIDGTGGPPGTELALPDAPPGSSGVAGKTRTRAEERDAGVIDFMQQASRVRASYENGNGNGHGRRR